MADGTALLPISIEPLSTPMSNVPVPVSIGSSLGTIRSSGWMEAEPGSELGRSAGGAVTTGAGATGCSMIWSGRVALLTRRLSVSRELEVRPLVAIPLLEGSSSFVGSSCC